MTLGLNFVYSKPMQVNNRAAESNSATFRGVFDVAPPVGTGLGGVAGALLGCFLFAVGSSAAAAFVPDQKGGSMPASSVSVSSIPVSARAGSSVSGSGDRIGSAGSGSVVQRNVQSSSARGGTSSYDMSWACLSAHNVDKVKLTHPAQLLALYLYYKLGRKHAKALREGKAAILSPFSAGHLQDIKRSSGFEQW